MQLKELTPANRLRTGHLLVMRRNSGSPECQRLHHGKKFFFIEHSISILICVIKHLLKLIIVQHLTRLLGNALHVLQGHCTCPVVIEEPECLDHVILGVLVQDLVRHHRQEFWEPNLSRAIIIHICDHFLDLTWLGLAPKRLHRDGQLLDIDISTSVSVKEVKGLLDLLLLAFIERGLLFAASRFWRHGSKDRSGCERSACCCKAVSLSLSLSRNG